MWVILSLFPFLSLSATLLSVTNLPEKTYAVLSHLRHILSSAVRQ